MEKIKVNIAFRTRQVLDNDYENYGPFPSRNAFLNRLIAEAYLREQEENEAQRSCFEGVLLEEGLAKAKAKVLAEKLSALHDPRVSLTVEGPLSESVSFRPEPSYEDIYDAIEENCLSSMTVSAYFRALLDSYANLPGAEREALLHRRNYLLIKKALALGKCIKLNQGSHKETIAPLGLYASKDGEYLYLAGFAPNRSPQRYHLHKLSGLVILQEDAPHIPEVESLRKAARSNPSFPGEEVEATVRLTKEGERQLSKIRLNRPERLSIEGDISRFSGTFFQLFSYFCRFGKEAVVLSPKKLSDALESFHRRSFHAYRKAAKEDEEKEGVSAGGKEETPSDMIEARR